MLWEEGNCPMVFGVKSAIFAVFVLAISNVWANPALQSALDTTYGIWRNAMLKQDSAQWQRATASYRQMEVRNRLVSERRAFPAGVFELPADPPALQGLRAVQVLQNGPTAKVVYFGKVDFGVGGTPTDNLLVLSFVAENNSWRYDQSEFVNLSALPEVRDELTRGDYKYVKETPAFKPSGVVPTAAAAVPTAKYIAKVYVYCPGREVEVQVNKISKHKFANTRGAEIVLGGAKDGGNEVQYAIRKLPDGTGQEALTVRVYVLSEIKGVMPLKMFEYQIEEKGKPKDADTGYFEIDAATVRKLTGK